MDVQKPFIGPVSGGCPAGLPPVGETGGRKLYLAGVVEWALGRFC